MKGAGGEEEKKARRGGGRSLLSSTCEREKMQRDFARDEGRD